MTPSHRTMHFFIAIQIRVNPNPGSYIKCYCHNGDIYVYDFQVTKRKEGGISSCKGCNQRLRPLLHRKSERA
jgi:hypothetical protein